jgi:predicted transcriptional regulator of viral defense system
VETLRGISPYAAQQWGMVTAAQAAAHGLPEAALRELAAHGVLTPVAWEVYAAVAAGPTPHAEAKAAWLALTVRPAWQRQPLDADSGVISHGSAAVVHGLGDLAAETVEITVPTAASQQRRGVSLRPGSLSPAEVLVLDGLPVTTVTRTILDVAADNIDGGHLAGIVVDAHQQGLVDFATLAPQLAAYAPAYGVPPGPEAGQRLVELLAATIGYRPQDRLAADLARRVRELTDEERVRVADVLGLRHAG